jgi:hypothetical protein
MMFFIAGMGASYSLRKRSARTFLTERIRRLVVPFLTGLLLLVPPIQYYFFKRLPLFEETFAQFYPTFFDVTPRWVFPPFLTGPRYMAHHLWFLRNLFVYTLVLLPLFLWLRGRARSGTLRSLAGRGLLERWTATFARPGALFLLALPVAAIDAALGAPGGWHRFSYIPFLLYGYVIASDGRFAQALRSQWKGALLLGLALFVVVGIPGRYWFQSRGIDFLTDPGLSSAAFRLLKGFVSWCLIVGFIGWASRTRPAAEPHPPTGNPQRPSLIDRAGRYLSQAALPIFTLHLTFLVVIGFYVVRWTNSMPIRFLLISIVATVDTLAVYDLVRRTAVTRFLFGMRRPDTTQASAEPQPAPRRGRSVTDWARANGPHVLLLAAAVLSSLWIIWAGSHSRSPVGKWQQTFDSTQEPSGYFVEFNPDGTWVVTAGEESIEGTYTLTADDRMELIYPDGRTTSPEYRFTGDFFALMDEDGVRKQVFARIR